MFTGDNVHVFKSRMEGKLRIKDLWDTIESGISKDPKFVILDGKAKAMILLHIEEDLLDHFYELKTAKEGGTS